MGKQHALMLVCALSCVILFLKMKSMPLDALTLKKVEEIIQGEDILEVPGGQFGVSCYFLEFLFI